nr:mucin-5AC-like [Penaeus vannamei]
MRPLVLVALLAIAAIAAVEAVRPCDEVDGICKKAESRGGRKCKQIEEGQCKEDMVCCSYNPTKKTKNRSCSDTPPSCKSKKGRCLSKTRCKEDIGREGCDGNCVCCTDAKKKMNRKKSASAKCKDRNDKCSKAGGKCQQSCSQDESVLKGKCQGEKCMCCVKVKDNPTKKTKNRSCSDTPPSCKSKKGRCLSKTRCKEDIGREGCDGNCVCCTDAKKKMNRKKSASAKCKDRNDKCSKAGGKCQQSCSQDESVLKGKCQGEKCMCCVKVKDEQSERAATKAKFCRKGKAKCTESGGKCKSKCKAKYVVKTFCRDESCICCNKNQDLRKQKCRKAKGQCKEECKSNETEEGFEKGCKKKLKCCVKPCKIKSECSDAGGTCIRFGKNCKTEKLKGGCKGKKCVCCLPAQSTAGPATMGTTTAGPNTTVPTTAGPNTTVPTTAGPTTAGPITTVPATAGPTTAGPTVGPTTAGPTAGPTTAGPTAGPTTAGPTTAGPTTAGPTTAGPTTAGPTTTLTVARNALLGKTCRDRLLDLEKQLNQSLAEGGEVLTNISNIFDASNPELSANLSAELTKVSTELQELFNRTSEITLLVNETTENLDPSVSCPADEYQEVLDNMTTKNSELKNIHDQIATLPSGRKRVSVVIKLWLRFTFRLCVGAQQILITVYVRVTIVFSQIDSGQVTVPGLPVGPTTVGPTTVGPTTAGPTTAGPTTAGPTTAGPTTAGPTTAPTTAGPTAGPTTAGTNNC